MENSQQHSKHKNARHDKQTRYLSQAIQLEESVNPHIIHTTLIMVSLALLTFITWAALTNINEVARTPGEVVPYGYQQTVQHLEGGIVKRINVRDGDVVQQGDVLMELDDSIVKEDLERAMSKQLFLQKQAERLRAFVEGRTPDFSKFVGVTDAMITDQKAFFDGMRTAREKEAQIVRDQITQKEQNLLSIQSDLKMSKESLSIAKDMYNRRLTLNRKGYVSDMQLLENKRQVKELEADVQRQTNNIGIAESEILEFEDRLQSLSAGHVDDAHERLSQVLNDEAQNIKVIDKLEERISRLKIRAPSHGLVKGLTVNTIGAVIAPGATLMEIVPLDKSLEISVKISPRDIGHLELGQPVQVKFSTFDFSRYGFIRGQLAQISATTFAGEQGERYYQGRVLVDRNYVGDDPRNIIMPGMTVMADIITGNKTILQYMLKPIHISLKTAFTER